MAVPQTTLIRSSQVTNHEYVRIAQNRAESTVWVFEHETNPTKVVYEKITSMQMVACFFCKTDHEVTVSVEYRRMVNSECHTTSCLPKVFVEIRKTNNRRRLIVHHGNASSHTSA